MSKKELKELIFLDPIKFEEAKKLNSTDVLTPTMARHKSRTNRRKKRKETKEIERPEGGVSVTDIVPVQ